MATALRKALKMCLVHSLESDVKEPSAMPERKWGSIPKGFYRWDTKHSAKAAAYKAEPAIRIMEPMAVSRIRNKCLDIGNCSMIALT